jgi:multidrug efflux pump
MTLSEISVRRPVFAAVISLLILVGGIVAFLGLPLRELPDIDQPVVSISTSYRGASAEVVETTLTRPIEERLAGIDGIDTITSSSRDGRSNITITFKLSRDIDDAAADVRAAVERVRDNLPEQAESPEVEKAETDARPIMWFNMASDTMNRTDLSDYAERFVVDRLVTIDGVAQVRVGGASRKAMRIWLDRSALAARGLTVSEVESALRSENVELPGGSLQGRTQDITIRIERGYTTVEDFERMPIGSGASGEIVRLGDVSRIELGPEEDRRWFRGNGESQIGIGIVRQSKSNALEVAAQARAEIDRIRPTLPEGVIIFDSYDSTLFIAESIKEVWRTLLIALGLVVLVIYLFLGSFRAALIPAAVLPVCLAGAFGVMALFGFSINILTLLALVLSIGLIVDDSIVVLENIQRRLDEGEPKLVAADRGSKQIFFAVVATTAVVVAVFMPLLFLQGYVSRLFVELAATISAAVICSSIVALSLTPMMASKLLKPATESRPMMSRWVDGLTNTARRSYRRSLDAILPHAWIGVLVLILAGFASYFLYENTRKELLPDEDRGSFFIFMSGPEGAGFEYSVAQMEQAEKILLEYVESGEAFRVLVSVPGFGGAGFSGGTAIVMLNPWDDRERTGQQIVGEINRKLGEIPGARFFGGMNSPIGRGGGDDIQFVIGGPDYDEINLWAGAIIDASRSNPGLLRVRSDYEPTSTRLSVLPDRERAADLGVPVDAVGRTLETMMGSRRVTRFEYDGEDYDVILQAEREFRASAQDLDEIYVRSQTTGEVIPLSNLVQVDETGASSDRRRVNRMRALTISATLAEGYTLGEAITWFQQAARENLSPEARTEFLGAAKEYDTANQQTAYAFAFALLIVFLVLAAQFESLRNPTIIMMTVPLAMAGGLFALYVTDGSLNIYSQIGLIILIGIAAKNGILIVEFANQLRDEGMSAKDAILKSAETRFRPVLMTSLSTAFGALPLALGDGAGSESRSSIGWVIFSGVSFATILTLFIVPVFYMAIGRKSGTPKAVSRRLDAYEDTGRVIAPGE